CGRSVRNFGGLGGGSAQVVPEVGTMAIAWIIVVGVLCAAGGSAVAYLVTRKQKTDLAKEASIRIEAMLAEDRAEEKDILLKAKDEALKMRTAVEQEAREARTEYQRAERRLGQKEENIDHKLESLEQREKSLADKEQETEGAKAELESLRQQQVRLRSGAARDCPPGPDEAGRRRPHSSGAHRRAGGQGAHGRGQHHAGRRRESGAGGQGPWPQPGPDQGYWPAPFSYQLQPECAATLHRDRSAVLHHGSRAWRRRERRSPGGLPARRGQGCFARG